jgi:hypothetical protein
MSSTCIYKEFAAKLPAEIHGQNVDQFLLVSLVGDSNCYTYSGKRSRSWTVQAVGTDHMIIADAIVSSRGFESGGLYFGNFGSSGYLLPEQYIAKVRRMIKNAHPLGENGWVNNVLIKPKQADMELASAIQAAVEKNKLAFDAKSRGNFYDLIKVEGCTD